MKRIISSIAAAAVVITSLTACLDVDSLVAQLPSTDISAPAQEPIRVNPNAPAAQLLEELTISDPMQNMHLYNRDVQFPHWMAPEQQYGWDASANTNCDVRWYQLFLQSTTQEWDDETSCVIGGDYFWTDPYGWPNEDTGEIEYLTSDDPSLFDIDHIVSLGEAWRTGAENLSQEERTSLANDPLNVIATYSKANQAKSDNSAELFLATSGEGFYFIAVGNPIRCEIATRYTQVKHKYNLTITEGDYQALAQVLNNECA